MAFVDEIKVNIKAGKGGDGVVRWRHEKGNEFMGPSGGDGGNGADVFVRGKKSPSLLQNYAHKKNFVAENGKDGSKDSVVVEEVNPTEIVYKKFNRPDGPLYRLPKSQILLRPIGIQWIPCISSSISSVQWRRYRGRYAFV